MGQATFDDDELFGEAAAEMREDVETALRDARAAIPEAEAIWQAEGSNILGVLNGLHTQLDVDAARSSLREAKKWYRVGVEADAFEDAADLEADIETVESIIGHIETVDEAVGNLTGTLPALKSMIEDLEEGDKPATDTAGQDQQALDENAA